MRMFVAVVPPPEVLDRLDTFLEPRRGADETLRWTDPYQWHVTLAFYADVLPRTVEELLERLRRGAARRGPVRVSLHGAGAFPSPHRAKVLWLGATAEPVDGLHRLADGARAAAARSGVDVEGGRFRAHLTVARMPQPANATRWLRILEAFEAPSWQVECVDLIESHLGEGRDNRPRYETVESFPVRGVTSGDGADQAG